MSWQSYVDTNLVGSGKVTKASIFGHDGSLWATSPSFKIGGEEAKILAAAFKDPKYIQEKGFHLEGQKYILLRADERSIYARNGATGVTCVKTGQCILVGFYDETVQAGDCTTVVEGLADYLKNSGY
ncbi:profilin, required for normal timing of actin polymerization in response to thermal stress [Mortierella alpina]|nr:profilin, required for normal timing of actin polymerization in response to thermal stress [Mortierella alpina]